MEENKGVSFQKIWKVCLFFNILCLLPIFVFPYIDRWGSRKEMEGLTSWLVNLFFYHQFNLTYLHVAGAIVLLIYFIYCFKKERNRKAFVTALILVFAEIAINIYWIWILSK